MQPGGRARAPGAGRCWSDSAAVPMMGNVSGAPYWIIGWTRVKYVREGTVHNEVANLHSGSRNQGCQCEMSAFWNLRRAVG